MALGETGLFSPDAQGLEPRAWRGPVYPAFIAAVESVYSRPWPGHVVLAQTLLSSAAVLAVAALAFLLGGWPAALFAATFCAFDPSQISAVSSLNIHGFYGLSVLLAAAAAALWAEKRTPVTTAVAGLSMAGSLLVRSSHFLAAPLLALAAVRRAGWKAGASLLLWTSLGLSLWSLRNIARVGTLSPFDVGGGSYSLLAASQGRLGAMSVPEGLALAESLRPGFRAAHPEQTDAENAMRALAYDEVSRRPGAFLAGCAERFFLFWKPQCLIVLLALAAFVFGMRGPALEAVGCVALSFSAYALIGGHPGYELGVAPALDVLAGCGAAALLTKTAPAPALAGRARSYLRLAVAALLALTGGVLLWSLVDAARGKSRPAPYVGPRVLAVLREGSVRSGGRWRKSVPAEELNAMPLRNEGVRLFLAGRADAAAESFRAAVGASPRSAGERLNLCVALDRLGRGREALAECERAVALAKNGPVRDSARSTLESLKKKRR